MTQLGGIWGIRKENSNHRPMSNKNMANLSDQHGPWKSSSWKLQKNSRADEGITAQRERI